MIALERDVCEYVFDGIVDEINKYSANAENILRVLISKDEITSNFGRSREVLKQAR